MGKITDPVALRIAALVESKTSLAEKLVPRIGTSDETEKAYLLLEQAFVRAIQAEAKDLACLTEMY